MTKFTSIELDFGLLGTKSISVWPNDKKKEGTNQPDYIVTTKQGEEWVKCGAGWKKESRDPHPAPSAQDVEAFL